MCQAVRVGLEIVRARFSSLEPDILQAALANAAGIDEKIAGAADATRMTDKIVGSVYSRFNTRSFLVSA